MLIRFFIRLSGIRSIRTAPSAQVRAPNSNRYFYSFLIKIGFRRSWRIECGWDERFASQRNESTWSPGIESRRRRRGPAQWNGQSGDVVVDNLGVCGVDASVFISHVQPAAPQRSIPAGQPLVAHVAALLAALQPTRSPPPSATTAAATGQQLERRTRVRIG